VAFTVRRAHGSSPPLKIMKNSKGLLLNCIFRVKKTLLSWSSGKDSAWALHILRRQPDIEVIGLFCTVNHEFGRVAMHAVRVELLQRQAEQAGLPVQLIPIPNPCSDSEYEAIMRDFIEEAKQQGVECFAFADLFLEDIRRYREANLAGTGISPIFPLWGIPTKQLSREMVNNGLRARITCIDPKHLTSDFAGQEYDISFLDRLPANVDPCGENGEFHTFAFDGPMFTEEVSLMVGETVSRDGFIFTDLLPETPDNHFES
jgi:uncharacterized protein (TIGR00290 family)